MLICLRRWPNLRHRARELTVWKSWHGERRFGPELDCAAVLSADRGFNVNGRGIRSDGKERRRCNRLFRCEIRFISFELCLSGFPIGLALIGGDFVGARIDCRTRLACWRRSGPM